MDANTQQKFELIGRVMEEVSKVVLGKNEIVKDLIMVLLAKGHILLEDVPGVGKTTLATAFAKTMSLEYKRIQFTPDVMPSDITGFSVYNKKLNDFEFKKGAAMCNVLLADEINRTSPKTQSSLLEVMEESSITVDGITYDLADPFFVIATQNPLGFIGTQPLPEAQLDRFYMKVSMGYPDMEAEMDILNNRKTADPMLSVQAVASAEDIRQAQEIVQGIHIDDAVNRYILELVYATRNHEMIELGASPRASLAMMKLAQACAFLNGREYVIPDDVLSVFFNAVNHRIVLKNNARLSGISVAQILEEIEKSVPMPVLE